MLTLETKRLVKTTWQSRSQDVRTRQKNSVFVRRDVPKAETIATYGEG